jgi:leader peptidase (prepilin peptidase) / N-methyltransferase
MGAAATAGARGSITFVAALFGLVIGSFLNVVVYRVPRRLSVVRPGSFCPACGTPIRSSDNVPVLSWIVLRAKCRQCGEPISARYPAVELATGALFGAVAWVLGAHWAVPGMCALAATTLALAAIELDGLPPPAAVSLIGTGVGAALLGTAAVADRLWWHLGGMFIGIAVAAVVVWAGTRVSARREPKIGLWGLLPYGAVLGWVGTVGAAIGVTTSAVGFVGLSVFLTMRGRQKGTSRIVPLALAAALGSGAAVIGAFAAGKMLGT